LRYAAVCRDNIPHPVAVILRIARMRGAALKQFNHGLKQMLVKFDSDVGSVTMFGEIATSLLKAMGHSGTIPGAIVAKDIPAALSALQSVVGSAPATAAGNQQNDDADVGEPNVSLRQRALPLIDLLSRAAERDVDVMWK
jgi:Domain of unknown function (DUF1840)